MLKKISVLFIVYTLAVMSLVSCGDKEPATIEKFIEVAEAEGCSIISLTAEEVAEALQDSPEYYDSLTIAQNADADWQVEFYDLASDENAAALFISFKNHYEENKGTVSGEISTSMGNSAAYSITTGGIYVYVGRIADTVVFVETPKENKTSVKAIIDGIGY